MHVRSLFEFSCHFFLYNNIDTGEWFQCRYYKAFATYAGCNVVLAAAAAALCAFIAPAAAGSGIPEVKAYLNGVDAYSILAPSTLFVKVNRRLCSLSLLT